MFRLYLLHRITAMRVAYVYQKNQFVFAQSQGHSPYPARVTSFDNFTGIYHVSFIGYKSSTYVTADMMEKFTQENIKKYQQLYKNSDVKEYKTILRKIELAKKQFIKRCKVVCLPYPNQKKSQMKSNSKSKSKESQKKQQTHHRQMEIQVREERMEQMAEGNNMIKNNINNDDETQMVTNKLTIPLIPQKNNCYAEYLEQSENSYFSILSYKEDFILQTPKHKRKQQTKFSKKSKKVQQLKEQLNLLSPIGCNSGQSQVKQQFSQIDQMSPSVGEAKVKTQNNQFLPISPKVVNVCTVSSMESDQSNVKHSDSSSNKMKQQHCEPVKQQPLTKQSLQLCLKYIKQLELTIKNEIRHEQHDEDVDWSIGSESEFKDTVLNASNEVDIYDIKCDFDQLQVNDLRGMLYTMRYRHQRISILSSQEIMFYLNGLMDELLQQCHRVLRGTKLRTLMPMKKKQYLRAILCLKQLDLAHYLIERCIFKMIDFACLYGQASTKFQQLFYLENTTIRSRINCLRIKFKTNSKPYSLSSYSAQELSNEFQRFQSIKFIIK